MLSAVHIPESAGADLDQEVLRTNLAWLLRLRWGAIAGQIITVLAVYFWMRIELPLWPVTAIVGIELLTNAGSALWARGKPLVRDWALALLMALDILLLT